MNTNNQPNSSFTEHQSHTLTCRYTGTVVASINCIKVAGHVPYLSHWKEQQAIHPLFSLELKPLLKFAAHAWAHFCSLTPEEAANTKQIARQEQILQITALAILHKISDIQQTTVWVPSIVSVSNNWNSLIPLAHWKNLLDSKRFKFPVLRISKNNVASTEHRASADSTSQAAIDLTSYLTTCWEAKKDYESRIKEAAEAEKARAADEALIEIRNDLQRKAPRSKKLLWRWFSAHLPSRYSRDMEGWMWDLFDAETEAEVCEFTMADIDLFEEIILCEIPTGSSVSHAFLDRLSHKRKLLETRFNTFEILIPEAVAAEKEAGTIAAEEPVLTAFPNKTAFLIAHAKWKLANTDTNKHRRAAAEKQAQVTVSASHIPTLELDEDGDVVGVDVPAVDVLAQLGFSSSSPSQSHPFDQDALF